MTDSQKKINNTFFGLDISSLNKSFNQIRRLISENILLIQFNYQSLIICEIKVSSNQIQINKVIKTDLPNEALDRSIPTDPEKISNLIKSICSENAIFVNTCYVIISPEAVFSKLINLPSELNIDEAKEYALIPNPLLEIPIPLAQTDFDIQKTSLKNIIKDDIEYTPYFLRSIPKELIDRLIESIKLCDLNLGYLDLPSIGFARLIDGELSQLKDGKFLIIIEFLKDCSYLYIYDKESTLSTIRLPAIRNFPEPDKSVLDRKNKNSFLKLENLVQKQENYLPISELDIRVFIKELKSNLNKFKKNHKELQLEKVFITGINSSYPEINDLISSKMNIETFKLNTITNKSFGNINMPNDLFLQEISRIFALSLSLLESNTDFSNQKKGKIKSKTINKYRKIIANQQSTNVRSSYLAKERLINNKNNSNNINTKKFEESSLVIDLDKKDLNNTTISQDNNKKDNPEKLKNQKEQETKKTNLSEFEESLKKFEDEKKLKNIDKKDNPEKENKDSKGFLKKSIKDETLNFND